MNYIVVNSVCCCLSICCKEVWESLYRIIGKSAFVKFAYLLIYFSAVVLTLAFFTVTSNSWPWVMSRIAPQIMCDLWIGAEHISCISAAVLYRMSCCLFIFSLFMLILIQTCSTRVALIINEGLFFSKFVLIIILFLISLQVSNQTFMAYGNLCKVVSYIFLVYQSIILIDLAYLWGIDWAKKYSQGSQTHAVLLIGFSIIMLGGCVAFLISSFTSHPQQIRWADIVCLCQIIVTIGVQLLNFNKQNSLLTTSVLGLLICYSTWAGGFSYPVSTPINVISNEAILYVGMAVSVLLLLTITAGSIYGSTNKQNDDNRFIDLDNLQARQEHVEMQREDKGKWTHWMLYLTGMSAYIAMVATDWGSADIAQNKFNLTTGAWISKLTMGFSVFFLYIWSLLAPRICPNRNFYFE